MLYNPQYGDVTYSPWYNACDFGYRQIFKQKVNCQTFSADFDRTTSKNTEKVEAFLSCTETFSWSLEVFVYDDTVALESSEISVKKIIEIPFVVKGLGIPCDEEPNDYYNFVEMVEDGISNPDGEYPYWIDFFEFGTRNESTSQVRRIRKNTSDTFTSRYKERAFVQQDYRRNRALGGFLDASVWVEDVARKSKSVG